MHRERETRWKESEREIERERERESNVASLVYRASYFGYWSARLRSWMHQQTFCPKLSIRCGREYASVRESSTGPTVISEHHLFEH